jgi:hypothetical protein
MLEFFINTRTGNIDIKGLGQGKELDQVKELHGEYMLDFIMRFSKMREQMAEPSHVIKWLTEFVRRYRNRELPIGYYRELARGNSYLLYDAQLDKYIAVSDTDDVDNLNIANNYVGYILPLANLYI